MSRSFWVLVAVVVGCGGKAVIDEPGDGGAGGAGGQGATGGNGGQGAIGAGLPTGGTGGATPPPPPPPPPICDTFASCCAELCVVVEDLPCFDIGECDCGQGGSGPCADATLSFYQCLLSVPGSLVCLNGGEGVTVACGVCEPELATFEQQCGNMLPGCG
jgi:hypothetical protein